MARKQIRVMTAPDYSYVSRGGAITQPVPYVITLGSSKGVKELDIFKAPLIARFDETIGETMHVITIREGGKAKYTSTGVNKLNDCEVVAITARKVTVRPLNIVPVDEHWRLTLDGNLVIDMNDFCASNTIQGE